MSPFIRISMVRGSMVRGSMLPPTVLPHTVLPHTVLPPTELPRSGIIRMLTLSPIHLPKALTAVKVLTALDSHYRCN